MTQAKPITSVTQQWLRYWRNSLADAESGRGALSKKALNQSERLESSVYREGRLPPEHPVLQQLFKDEPASRRLVRVALRPAVFKTLQEHGAKKQSLYPDVITPLICGLWISRDGCLIPAEPPVIPRDLLQPQADDRFTLANVSDQDHFLSKAEPRVWSESEAQTLLEQDKASEHETRWKTYYDISRQLFDQLCPRDLLRTAFVSLEEARIVKVDDQLGAARHVIKLYDWLSTAEQALPLLEGYALSKVEQYQSCIDPLEGMPTRLGHANTQYPLAIAQRDALAQVMAMEEGELLAVNGPPGTGKTTFMLSVVASLWVEAALGQTEPPLIVAASTNNQAVTNVLEAFAKGFEEPDDAFGGRWLPDVTSYGGYYSARSREKEAAKHYQTPLFYRRVESPDYLDRAETAFLEHARQALDDKTLDRVGAVKKQLHRRLQDAQAQLLSLQDRWVTRARLQAQLIDKLGNPPEERLAREQNALDILQADRDAVEDDLKNWQRFCAEEPMWLVLLAWLPAVAKKRGLRRELFVREQLSAEAQQLIDQASSACEPELILKAWLDKQRERIEQKKTFLAGCREQQQALQWAAAALEADYRRLGIDTWPDSFDAFDQALDTSLRFHLFQLAVHYWEARWLEDCAERSDELAEQTAKGREKPGLSKVRPRWRRRMMLTPCIVSTLHSLPSHMTHSVFESEGQYRDEYLTNEIDLLIIDEAGQVAPDVAGASLALAKRLLAVGDIHQIKPVATQSETVDVGNLAHQGILTSLAEYEGLRESARTVVDGSVMRIAQAASRVRYLDEAEPGMFLREHRRCLGNIIAYCNELCYRGLLQPMRATAAIDSDLPPLGYVHVDGRVETPASGSRINQLEATTVAEWLADQRARLERVHGQPLEKIVGVVTPFKAQAHLIEQECQKRDIRVGREDAAMTVGTIHALQGAERPVVVFSAVYSRHDDGNFIDMDPSLLNVAVSRAKDSFLVFGDMDKIGGAARGTPRRLLAKYLFAEENNELTFTASVARPDLLALCETPRIINDAEAHDRCIKELLENARHWVAMVSPWISLQRLEEVGLLEELQRAANRSIAITIYTDHHFNTTSANRLDEAKRERFEQCCEALSAIGLDIKVVNQVHSKLIMADDRFLCVGSYNWASAARNGNYKNMETSMLYSGNLVEETRLQLEALNDRVRQ